MEIRANMDNLKMMMKVLHAKRKDLKSQGKGNTTNWAGCLTAADEEKLWETSALGTPHTETLLDTVWLILSKCFGFRRCLEFQQLKEGDITKTTWWKWGNLPGMEWEAQQNLCWQFIPPESKGQQSMRLRSLRCWGHLKIFWFHFVKMAPTQVVMANTHQGSPQFAPYNEVQCTAVAYIALLTFMQCVPASRWGPREIDSILWEGTFLYKSIFPQVSSPANPLPYLSHVDLPLSISGFPLHVTLDQQGFVGVISFPQDYSHLGFQTLHNALQMEFAFTPPMLFTAGVFTIAIFHCQLTDTYYVFDSHACDVNGFPSQGLGAACFVALFQSVTHTAIPWNSLCKQSIWDYFNKYQPCAIHWWSESWQYTVPLSWC